MSPSATRSRDYVFTTEGKSLRFVGNFDGLYAEAINPWDQAGSPYYRESRQRLCDMLAGRSGIAVEVGCGLGFALNVLAHNLRSLEWFGLDISYVAIDRAREIFPSARFIEANIADWQTPITFDVVVLNQCLWYLLERLDETIANCHRILNDGGVLLISQAFLRGEQRYGKDICDGFAGTVARMINQHGHQFSLIEARHDDAGRLEHNDGLLMLRKRNAIRSDERKPAP